MDWGSAIFLRNWAALKCRERRDNRVRRSLLPLSLRGTPPRCQEALSTAGGSKVKGKRLAVLSQDSCWELKGVKRENTAGILGGLMETRKEQPDQEWAVSLSLARTSREAAQ